MKQEFRALLMTIPEVAALGAGRVNWGTHPQGVTLPAIVINKISGSEWMHMNGPNGVYQARIQVDCDGMTLSETTRISSAIHDALHGYRGGGFRYIEGTNDDAARVGGSNEAVYPFRASEDFMTTWRAS